MDTPRDLPDDKALQFTLQTLQGLTLDCTNALSSVDQLHLIRAHAAHVPEASSQPSTSSHPSTSRDSRRTRPTPRRAPRAPHVGGQHRTPIVPQCIDTGSTHADSSMPSSSAVDYSSYAEFSSPVSSTFLSPPVYQATFQVSQPLLDSIAEDDETGSGSSHKRQR